MQKEEVINKAYNEVFKSLTLLPNHYDDLVRRGLNQKQIFEKGYKSFTGSMQEKISLGRTIEESIGKSAAMVPGIYRDQETSNLLLNTIPGLVIPCRNQKGQIHCLRIRYENEEGKNYYYLSSSNLDGPPVSTGLHFSKSFEGEEEVWLTEGPLKADIASIKSERLFVALPSVTTLASLKELEGLSFKKIILAFDMDFMTNSMVLRALAKAFRELKKKGVEVCLATWKL